MPRQVETCGRPHNSCLPPHIKSWLKEFNCPAFQPRRIWAYCRVRHWFKPKEHWFEICPTCKYRDELLKGTMKPDRRKSESELNALQRKIANVWRR